jgi:hypothetical protein
MTITKTQRTAKPTRKVAAGGLAGVIANGLFELTPWEESGSLKGWLSAGIVLLVAYFTKSALDE